MSVLLYLVRHGVAEEPGEAWPDDSKRPLTAKGKARLREVAQGLLALDVQMDEVLSSPFVRARQTAEVLASAYADVPPITLLPALAVGGGFVFEDQIFKGLAMGAPYVKLVGMARAPIAAAMVGKTIGLAIGQNELPVYVQRFGDTKDEIFVTASALRKELGDKEFETVPTGALGLYTFYERLAQGLRQLMAGARKFSLEHISRDDLASLTPEASQMTGITYLMDVDQGAVERIFGN